MQEPNNHGGFDACSPRAIAGRVEAFSVVASDGGLGFVASRFVGGTAFCLGLIFALAVLIAAPIGIADALHNLVPVVAGGGVLVALVCFVIYVRGEGIRDGAPAALPSREAAP